MSATIAAVLIKKQSARNTRPPEAFQFPRAVAGGVPATVEEACGSRPYLADWGGATFSDARFAAQKIMAAESGSPAVVCQLVKDLDSIMLQAQSSRQYLVSHVHAHHNPRDCSRSQCPLCSLMGSTSPH